MKGICALYEIESGLRESHIFPKFVLNHTKKTGSQYFRRVVEPNKRLQDGVKLHLLSEKAEQDFSLREKWFAEKIFVPYTNNKFELEYTEEMYYFAISFLWRIIQTELKTDDSLKNKWYFDELLKVEKEWRQFLSKGIFPENYSKSYIWFTDRVVQNNTELKGVDFYLTRAMDATIVDNKTHTFLAIYGKFNRFIFWSVLKKFGGEENLTDLEINPIKGKFIIPQKLDYFPIISFLGHRIKTINEFPLPNQEQQSKIEKEILKNPEEFWKSDLGKSLYNDNFNLDN